MNETILNSIKLALGYEKEYTAFDHEIIIHINAALMKLKQKGVGVKDFVLRDSGQNWKSFTGANTFVDLEALITYVFIEVKLIMDPPSSSYHTTALRDQAEELLWRLGENAERNEEDE